MKDTPIQILDHIYYRDEASLETNKFRIASNDSQRMLDKNFSVCLSSSDERSLFIALNEKIYDANKIDRRDAIARVIYLSNKKKVSILSCEEYEDQCIKRILGKIYDLHESIAIDIR
ncbi:MAG: hypothetical protein KBI25_05775 [Clostridia bacterium]|nr:hypothetical protein [Clostridia bacterium]